MKAAVVEAEMREARRLGIEAPILVEPTPELWYDYDMQVWVLDGRVQGCEHPARMREAGCCNGNAYRALSYVVARVKWLTDGKPV